MNTKEELMMREIYSDGWEVLDIPTYIRNRDERREQEMEDLRDEHIYAEILSEQVE